MSMYGTIHIRSALAFLLCMMLPLGCQRNESLTVRDQQQVREAIVNQLHGLAGAMESRSADDVAAHFLATPDFLYTADGSTYQSLDSLAADVRRGYDMMNSVTMVWEAPNIAVLDRSAAHVVVPFRQQIVLTSGDTLNIRGVWSGVYVERDDHWLITRGHLQTFD